MAESRIQSFAEFWPCYLGEHRCPASRGLHYLGTSLGMVCFALAFATLQPLWLLAGLAVGYGHAWVGHFFIERNRPATFTYPLYSFGADFKMLAFALRGKMPAEMTRLYGCRAPAPDAPLLARN